jgi:hypothetical protein
VLGTTIRKITTTNVSKTRALLPPTTCKDVPNTLCGWLSIRYFVTFMYTYAQNQVKEQLFINFLHILLFCFMNNQVYFTFLLIPWIWNMSIYVLTYLKSDANFLCTEGTCMWNLFFFYFIYELSASISVHKRYKIPNGQSRETGSIEYTSWRQTKQQQNIMCVGHHYPQNNHN